MLCFILVGCQGLFGPQGMPQDPLFLSRKPLEVKAKSAPPQEIACSEPALPPRPGEEPKSGAIAQGQESKSSPSTETKRTVPGTLTKRTKSQPQ